MNGVAPELFSRPSAVKHAVRNARPYARAGLLSKPGSTIFRQDLVTRPRSRLVGLFLFVPGFFLLGPDGPEQMPEEHLQRLLIAAIRHQLISAPKIALDRSRNSIWVVFHMHTFACDG